MATLPEYQGHGIGSTLLQWGIEKSVQSNRRIFLEATVDGYRLYCMHGWRTLEDLTIDYERLGGKGEQIFMLMIREANLG